MPGTGESSGTHTPLIIGLYGISGAGKSHLLKQLARSSLSQRLDFADGSALIDRSVGPANFKDLSVKEQNDQRAKVMSGLVEQRRKSGKGVVIAGHAVLWDSAAKKTVSVATEADWRAYTHIVYFQVDPEVVYARREKDGDRKRGVVSVEELGCWQARERAVLRKVCYERRIQFTTITEHEQIRDGRTTFIQLQALLGNFLDSDEQKNSAAVDSALDAVLLQCESNLETMLVFDADKTLAPQDASSQFWDFMNERNGMPKSAVDLILKPQGYSYESFRQVALLYEEVADSFDYMCSQVAAWITMYPEMAAFLARVALEPHAGAVVVTCGLREVWERVLRISGLTHVKVIGGGLLKNGYVVTDTVKGQIVDKLKVNNLRVVAFGDSALDVDMLKKADESYVIVGEKNSRSVSMDRELAKLVDDGCSPRQILLPATVEPRLTGSQVPIVQLDETTLRSIFKRRFLHATSKASARLLMTAMRDAENSGQSLRKAHEEVGYYLAIEYLGDVLGVESYSMKHFTGGSTDGYRFRGEEKTLIVALMRGGAPMALGVSKALKAASFVHSKAFADLDPRHFEVKETFILVDSVVNSGQSIMEYLVPLRELSPKVKVVVVAGVVQARAVENDEEGGFGQLLRKDPDLTLVALRTSDNKYTGRGPTDTGHRLFNTTYLPLSLIHI